MKRNSIVEKDFMYRGKRCVVVGGSQGHRCGYVEVQSPTDEMINDPYSLDYDVHGGVTYGDYSSEYPVTSSYHSFWLGFDCAHYGDGKDMELVRSLNDNQAYFHLAKMEEMFPNDDPIRDTRYVEGECKRLVDQILK